MAHLRAQRQSLRWSEALSSWSLMEVRCCGRWEAGGGDWGAAGHGRPSEGNAFSAHATMTRRKTPARSGEERSPM
eukprot:CAMPEP_0117664230 /NCGR_PEP_ID=MMETSP0804-20121206/9095_1 /TAXON_ID=1074897 /ORGANISM="Tetraselmis astigmatica, Strain CCMP880" /LENGTH=74 /DNA_ID=CAMNT_0005471421 /DNA_START=303 /DNA_END=527 /DNA_ORIENTATION=+